MAITLNTPATLSVWLFVISSMASMSVRDRQARGPE